jgi:hypothetical protein
MKIVVTSMCLAAALCAGSAHGADPKGVERFRTLTVETVYPFKQFDFDPPLQVLSADGAPAPSDGDTPLGVLRSHFAAMRKGDVDAFLLTWNRAAREQLAQAQLSGEAERTAAVARWRSVLGGRDVSLDTRVEFGNYVLLAYSVRDGRSAKVIFKDTVAFAREQGQWKLTQALAKSPVLNSWNTPGGRVQVAPGALLDGQP